MIESIVESHEATIECTSCIGCKEVLNPEDFEDIQILEFVHMRGGEPTKQIVAICPSCAEKTGQIILSTAQDMISEVCPNYRITDAKIQVR